MEPVATIKPPFGLPSTVRADILCGVMRVANDPDADTIQDWFGTRCTAGHGHRQGKTTHQPRVCPSNSRVEGAKTPKMHTMSSTDIG